MLFALACTDGQKKSEDGAEDTAEVVRSTLQNMHMNGNIKSITETPYTPGEDGSIGDMDSRSASARILRIDRPVLDLPSSLHQAARRQLLTGARFEFVLDTCDIRLRQCGDHSDQRHKESDNYKTHEKTNHYDCDRGKEHCEPVCMLRGAIHIDIGKFSKHRDALGRLVGISMVLQGLQKCAG